MSRVWTIAFAFLAFVIAGAQTSVGSLVAHPNLKASLKPADLPDSFKATIIDVEGANGIISSLSPMLLYGMINGGRNGGGGDDTVKALTYVQVVWTGGSTVQTDAGTYLATYQMDPVVLMGGEKPSAGSELLKLVYVRRDVIVSLSPRPDVTREGMVAYFSEPEGGSSVPTAQGTSDNRTAAISNLKQAALGMIIYASDFDDELPYVQDSASAFVVTYPYVKSREQFKSRNPQGSRILFNMAIAGVNMNNIPEPAKTVLYFDEKAWPDGGRPVAFADGHVKYLSASEWAQAAKSLHLKLKRTAKPLPPKLKGYEGGGSDGGG